MSTKMNDDEIHEFVTLQVYNFKPIRQYTRRLNSQPLAAPCSIILRFDHVSQFPDRGLQ
jgi:hypothetical protein